MLRVTIEVIPAGNPQKKRTVRVLDISNLTDLADSSDYSVVAIGESAASKKEGIVRGHRRLKWGPWKLVAKAIHTLQLDLESW